MKLYFYILEKPYNKKPFIRFEECEVIENPKTYKPKDRFPMGVYGCYVSKSDIGTVSGYSNNLVVLTEPNSKVAKELFTKLYESNVRQKEEYLAEAKVILNAILEMEEE